MAAKGHRSKPSDVPRWLSSAPTARKRVQEEGRRLIDGHSEEITVGKTEVEAAKTGLLVAIDGIKFQVPRGVGEELLAQLTRALRPYAGYSIFDMLMIELDVIIDRLMAGEPSEDGNDPGKAAGLTLALAFMRNAYQPDFLEEKRHAMRRFKERENGDADSEILRREHKRAQRGPIEGYED